MREPACQKERLQKRSRPPNAQKQLPCKQKMSLHSSAPAQTSAVNSCPSSNSPKQHHFLDSKSSEAALMDL